MSHGPVIGKPEISTVDPKVLDAIQAKAQAFLVSHAKPIQDPPAFDRNAANGIALNGLTIGDGGPKDVGPALLAGLAENNGDLFQFSLHAQEQTAVTTFLTELAAKGEDVQGADFKKLYTQAKAQLADANAQVTSLKQAVANEQKALADYKAAHTDSGASTGGGTAHTV